MRAGAAKVEGVGQVITIPAKKPCAINLDLVDKKAQEKYRTLPGIVKDGVAGGVELVAAVAVGPVVKQSVRGAQAVARTTANASKYVYTSIDSASIQTQTITLGSRFAKEELGTLRLPFSGKKMAQGEVGGISANLRRNQIALQENKLDRALLEKLSQELSTVEIPIEFPQKRAQVMANSKRKYIKDSTIEAFYYKPIKDDVVLFMPSVNRMYAGKERLEKAVVAALDFAQQQKGRVFVTWDPATHSIASVIDEKSKNAIIGIGKLSNGPYTEPFPLIEIASTVVRASKAAQSESTLKLVNRSKIIKFLKDESGSGKLPVDREFFIKSFLDLEYKLSKGGKGSHLKLVKPKSPMVIIPLDGELATGTAQSLMRTYEKAKSIANESLIVLEQKIYPKVIKEPLHNKPFPHRIDYSEDYFKGKNEFIMAKEFNGILSRDLFVIQYHSSEPLHEFRTHKWFMPVCEGNKHCTIEEVQNAMAKLSACGQISHVTLARIPPGEPVRFLYGRAMEKIDPVNSEVRPGGGVQYRFFDFDLNWIVLTKKLT
jgi:hypothetical protein